MRRKKEEWMRQVELGQDEIVPKHSLSYEGQFWQNIISGKRHFSSVQVIGIGIVYGAVAFLLWWILRGLVSSPILGCLLLCGYGALFLLLRWRVRKALK